MAVLTILKVIVMIISGLGALYGVYAARKGSHLGKPVAVVCALVALGLSVQNMLGSRPNPEKYMKISEKYNFFSGAELGEFLAQKYAGKRVLILTRPDLKIGDYARPEVALLEGIKSTLQDRAASITVVSPEFPDNLREQLTSSMGLEGDVDKAENEEYLMMEMINLENWFGVEQFDALVARHQADCDVMVLTFDLPMDFEQAAIFKQENGPKLALINVSPYLLKNHLVSGDIAAAVTYKPDPEAWKINKEIPSDQKEAFNKRYLMLTPENINAMASTYPQLFEN